MGLRFDAGAQPAQAVGGLPVATACDKADGRSHLGSLTDPVRLVEGHDCSKTSGAGGRTRAHTHTHTHTAAMDAELWELLRN